jgi:hypothetical protein
MCSSSSGAVRHTDTRRMQGSNGYIHLKLGVSGADVTIALQIEAIHIQVGCTFNLVLICALQTAL